MKSITPKELMNHSFVISVDDKRFNQFRNIFTKYELFPLPQKFQGISDPKNPPHVNCYLSHREIILKAKDLDWPYVCIFEDDAYPLSTVGKELEYYLSEIPDEVACLLLGDTKMMKSSKLNDKFYNKISCCGSQSYIVFKDFYDKYIQFLDASKYSDCFIRDRDNILPKSLFLRTRKVLFIQYTAKKSMNGHIGYNYRNGGRDLTQEEIFKMGFEPIS